MADNIPGQNRARTAPVQGAPGDEGAARDRRPATQPLTVDDMYTRAERERTARLGADTFYHHDRPDNPSMFEDRPRGGGTRLKHQKSWVSLAMVIAFFIVLIMGMALFA